MDADGTKDTDGFKDSVGSSSSDGDPDGIIDGIVDVTWLGISLGPEDFDGDSLGPVERDDKLGTRVRLGCSDGSTL
jgi:hypothetical protein